MQGADADIIAGLYDGIVNAARLEAGIDAIVRRFACRCGTLVSFDPVLPAASMTLVVGVLDEAARQRYHAEFAADDPMPGVLVRLPSGSVHASDRLFSDEFRRRSVMLNEYLRPLGLEETLGGTISAEDGRFTLLGLQRGPDRKAFTGAEIAGMQRLMPHVQRALQLRRAFARLNTQVSALSAMIDRLTTAVIVLDESGGALHVNRAARELAARGDGLVLDQYGTPRALAPEADGRLEAVRRDAAGAALAGSCACHELEMAGPTRRWWRRYRAGQASTALRRARACWC